MPQSRTRKRAYMRDYMREWRKRRSNAPTEGLTVSLRESPYRGAADPFAPAAVFPNVQRRRRDRRPTDRRLEGIEAEIRAIQDLLRQLTGHDLRARSSSRKQDALSTIMEEYADNHTDTRTTDPYNNEGTPRHRRLLACLPTTATTCCRTSYPLPLAHFAPPNWPLALAPALLAGE